jgi:predicted AlkP superfamily phosphohydrolase/phosphomutase
MSDRQIVLIAIDSGDSRLISKWAAEGYLPTMVRLLENGAIASIETPVGVLEGAVWPTLLMSLNPGNHGLFAYRQIIPGTYDLKIATLADRLPQPPFWVSLSRAGKRVAIVDAPFAKPWKGLNGIQVTNWGAHDPWSWKRSSWPPRLIDDLARRFGDHPVGMCDAQHRTRADFETLRDGLIAGVKRKTELLRHCLKLEPWDFFFGVFSESHCVGHQCWHFADPSCPRHEPDAPSHLKTAMRDVYREIDKGLGALLQDLSPDTNVFILLSHGMGPYYHGSHLLSQLIDQLGVNENKNNAVSKAAQATTDGNGFRRGFWNARHLLPSPSRRFMKSVLPREVLNSWWLWAHPEEHPWGRLRVFQVPSSNMTGALRINLKGREPNGMVEPGAEYDAICNELTQVLMELQNPATGRAAVQWVSRASDLYHGIYLDWLPDLLVEWDHSAPIFELASPRIGSISGTPRGARTASHWPQSLMIASGPGIAPGALGQEMQTIDVAPTIVGLFGVQQANYFEGRDYSTLFSSSVHRPALKVACAMDQVSGL